MNTRRDDITKIIGIDPGLAKMGVVTLDIYNDEIKESTPMLIQSSAKDYKYDVGRWAYMCNVARGLISKAEPEIVLCEFPFGSKGNGRINVEIFAVIKYYCFSKEIPFIPVAASTLKKYATGHGKGEKSDMRLQAYKEFGLEYGEDETDAYWLAHLGYVIRYRKGTKERLKTAETLEIKHLKGG